MFFYQVNKAGARPELVEGYERLCTRHNIMICTLLNRLIKIRFFLAIVYASVTAGSLHAALQVPGMPPMDLGQILAAFKQQANPAAMQELVRAMRSTIFKRLSPGLQAEIKAVLALSQPELSPEAKQEFDQAMRIEMFTRLSPELQAKIASAEKIYNSLLRKLPLTACLSSLVKECADGLTTLIQDQEYPEKQNVLAQCAILAAALEDGAFTALVVPQRLEGGQDNPMQAFMARMGMNTKKKPKTLFTEMHLYQAKKSLQTFLDDVAQREQTTPALDALVKKIEVLEALLALAKQRKMHELCTACLATLKPEFGHVQQELQRAASLLISACVELLSIHNEDLSEALHYWRRQLQVHAQTLKSFLRVASQSQLVDMGILLHVIGSVYDVVDAFVGARPNDDDSVVTRLSDLWYNPGDFGLRLALVTVALGYNRGETASAVIAQHMLDGMSLKEFISPFANVDYPLKAMAAVYPLLMNPYLVGGSLSHTTNMALRVIGAWLLQDLDIKKLPENIKIFLQSLDRAKLFADLTNHEWPANFKEWPADKRYMRIAMASIVNHMSYLSQVALNHKVWSKLDADELGALSDYSMGLLKPELFNLMLFKMAVPWAMVSATNAAHHPSASKVVQFQPQDFYDRYALAYLREQFVKDHGRQPQDDMEFGTYLRNNKRLYAEYKLISYGFTQVGAFWGRKLGPFIQKPITSALMAAGKGVASAVLDTDVEATITKDLDRLLQDFKDQLRPFLQAQGPNRSFVIMGARSMGIVDDEDIKAGPIYVNVRMIAYVLNFAAQYGLIPPKLMTSLIDAYKERYHNNIDGYVDFVAQAIKNSLESEIAGAVGDKAGGFIGGWAAEKFVRSDYWISIRGR